MPGAAAFVAKPAFPPAFSAFWERRPSRSRGAGRDGLPA